MIESCPLQALQRARDVNRRAKRFFTSRHLWCRQGRAGWCMHSNLLLVSWDAFSLHAGTIVASHVGSSDLGHQTHTPVLERTDSGLWRSSGTAQHLGVCFAAAECEVGVHGCALLRTCMRRRSTAFASLLMVMMMCHPNAGYEQVRMCMYVQAKLLHLEAMVCAACTLTLTPIAILTLDTHSSSNLMPLRDRCNDISVETV